jgi:SAM-dependent methyltransferase
MSLTTERPTGEVRGDAEYATTRQAWSDIWEHTDISRELQTREYARAREIRDCYRPYLPMGAPILEAGCGLGVELLGLHEAGYKAIGLDYVEGAVRRLRDWKSELRILAGDIHALPFRDGSFGAYLSFGVLEHFVSGPEPGLREANRVLCNGGILVITVPAPQAIWRLTRSSLWRAVRGKPRPAPYYETAYSAVELARTVRQSGFSVQEIRPVGHSFTLWGCGRVFRGRGYYETSALAEILGAFLRRVWPYGSSFATLIVARKNTTPGMGPRDPAAGT